MILSIIHCTNGQTRLRIQQEAKQVRHGRRPNDSPNRDYGTMPTPGTIISSFASTTA